MKRLAHVGDSALTALGVAFAAHSYWRDRRAWQPLADVQVPNRLYKPVLMFLLVRQRRTDRAIADFGKATGELGTTIGTRWKEGDNRDRELLGLTRSVERLTKWLIYLTVAVALVGVASIAVTVTLAA